MSKTDKSRQTDYADVQSALERSDRRYYLFESQPVAPSSPTDRERLILQLVGDLLAMKVGDAEWVRREFGRRFGTNDIGPISSEEVDLSRAAEGIVRVTYTLTSAHDYDRLRRVGFLRGESGVGLRGIFRDHDSKRERWREPETIIRAVAIHYLSRGGGGVRTIEGAVDHYAKEYPSSRGTAWDPGKHAQIIRHLEAEYGLLP